MAEEERKKKARKALKNGAPIGVAGSILTIIGLYMLWDWLFNTYFDSFELVITESLRNAIIALVLGLLMLVYAIQILQSVEKPKGR